MEQRLILINQLVKLGVAAAVAAGLIRWVEFKSLLFREDRSLKQKIQLVLWVTISAWIGIRLALGVWIRFGAESSFAADLSFETILLLGVIAGRFGQGTLVLGGAALEPSADYELTAAASTVALSLPLEEYFDTMEEHFSVARSTLLAIAQERDDLLER